MDKLFLYGAGGLGREIKSWADGLTGWQVGGFFDDVLEKGTIIHGLPVLGGFDELKACATGSGLVIAIGSPKIKSALLARLENLDLTFPILKHPSAIVQDANRVILGSGCIITAGSILTTGVQLGRHVLLNLHCTVGHDVTIGDCSAIMPGVNIAGNVHIGKNVLVGSGAIILNGVCIGDNAIVGAGAVVTRDVAESKTVVGVPAQVKGN